MNPSRIKRASGPFLFSAVQNDRKMKEEGKKE